MLFDVMIFDRSFIKIRLRKFFFSEFFPHGIYSTRPNCEQEVLLWSSETRERIFDESDRAVASWAGSFTMTTSPVVKHVENFLQRIVWQHFTTHRTRLIWPCRLPSLPEDENVVEASNLCFQNIYHGWTTLSVKHFNSLIVKSSHQWGNESCCCSSWRQEKCEFIWKLCDPRSSLGSPYLGDELTGDFL